MNGVTILKWGYEQVNRKTSRGQSSRARRKRETVSKVQGLHVSTWCGRLARKWLDENRPDRRTGRPHHMTFETVSLALQTVSGRVSQARQPRPENLLLYYRLSGTKFAVIELGLSIVNGQNGLLLLLQTAAEPVAFVHRVNKEPVPGVAFRVT